MPVAVAFTIEEACQVLDPPLTPRQLRDIVHALRLQPAGRRRNGRAGRPVSVYDWAQITKLHQAVLPWLVTTRDFSG